jgi:gamma-glutamyltranspeptidase/glutathione hydrolase
MLNAVFGRSPEPWLAFDPTRARPAIGRAAAATANPLASWAACSMLKAGGSAVDAAVAAQAVLTAVEPNASGIGGGAVILVSQHGQVTAIDGLSMSPAKVTERLDRDFDGRIVPAERASFGGRTAGVPGALRALELAHLQFGRLPWADLFQPAIALCEDGYPMSAYLLRALRENPGVQTEAMARLLYADADGALLDVGTPIRNPALAATLRLIAAGGADAFYEGSLAQDICHAVAADAFPGTMTPDDLAAYTPVVRAASRFTLGQYQVAGGCLPAFGAIAVGQVIGIAAAMGLTGLGADMDADAVHILIEAGRLAYADRAVYAGDPDFHPCDVPALLEPGYLASRAECLDVRRRTEGLTAGTADGESMTSHLSIADDQGCVVSMTTTINNNFGSRVSVGGFYLNNVMTNFAARPIESGRRSVNAMVGHKRARTSIAPCLVFDAAGDVVAAVGAGGGNRIIGYVADALLRLAGGMDDPQAIVAAPHALNSAGMAEVEPPLDRHVAELAARGHWMMPRRLDGGTQMVIRTKCQWSAGGDPRRDGCGMAVV